MCWETQFLDVSHSPLHTLQCLAPPRPSFWLRGLGEFQGHGIWMASRRPSSVFLPWLSESASSLGQIRAQIKFLFIGIMSVTTWSHAALTSCLTPIFFRCGLVLYMCSLGITGCACYHEGLPVQRVYFGPSAERQFHCHEESLYL